MNEMMSPADFAAITGNNRSNDNGWGDGGAWWIIILFLFMWGRNGWGGNGNGSGSAVDGYVLTSPTSKGRSMA